MIIVAPKLSAEGKPSRAVSEASAVQMEEEPARKEKAPEKADVARKTATARKSVKRSSK